ncbi:MAG: hypothetical protein HY687_05220 [Chloroflexi bacterium]|nr:hypothetical protein [Chloroflexota bacterium]
MSSCGTTMKYLPFGSARSGSVPTERRFTGQRLDGSGLYFTATDLARWRGWSGSRPRARANVIEKTSLFPCMVSQ